jgi:hypothetical protein
MFAAKPSELGDVVNDKVMVPSVIKFVPSLLTWIKTVAAPVEALVDPIA